jgi:excisionase family DNA binding protein
VRAELAKALSDPLLTQAQVCAVFGVSVKTLQRWRRMGRISFARLGHRTIRIRQSQILQIVRESQL